jgi:RNA polymerase sigma-70 factor (ECF subfamily)
MMLSPNVSSTNSQGKSASDGVLMEQALAGDQHAFELLVHRYHPLLTNYIRSFLYDGEQIDDVLQHVFLRLSACLPLLSTDRPLKAWLFQVARYRCLDELRKRKRRPEVPFSTLAWQYKEEEFSPIEVIPDPEPLPEEIAEKRDLQGELQQAIGFLPPRLRSIVCLHSFRQLTFAEIGLKLNMRENTVKTYFYRSLPLLRQTLVSNQRLLSNS